MLRVMLSNVYTTMSALLHIPLYSHVPSLHPLDFMVHGRWPEGLKFGILQERGIKIFRQKCFYPNRCLQTLTLTYNSSLMNYTNALESFSGKTISTPKKHLMRRRMLASTHKIVATASPTVICSVLELARPPELSLCEIAKPAVNSLA